MKHKVLSVQESPSFGGMSAEIETTQLAVRDNAYGTTPVSWWGWPDEAQLADFAKKDDRVKQAEQPLENNLEYATLYFVS